MSLLSQSSPVASAQITAEIMAIGTEVVMGEVVNTNASWLSQQLADLGINVYFHTAVGDNPQRIKDSLALALQRADLLLITGGLGPTDDDLTIATLADYFDLPLTRDEAISENLRQFFMSRNMPMSKSNLKQADKPDLAEFLDNAVGTAPGQLWDVSTRCPAKHPKLIITLPGVPSEMKHIWAHEVIHRLKAAYNLTEQLYSTSLRFFNIGESALAERIQDLMNDTNPSVATYVGQAEVRVRLAAKARTPKAAEAIIRPVAEAIMARLNDYYYGTDDTTMEAVVGQRLRNAGQSISVAESCTGGLISARLTDMPGSSAYILSNVVTYSNEAKVNLLGVSRETLAQHGAVSEAVAIEMAQGVRKLSDTDYGLAITGIAGPDGGSTEKPVGLAYIALSMPDGKSISKEIMLNPRYDRLKQKFWFSQHALWLVLKALEA